MASKRCALILGAGRWQTCQRRAVCARGCVVRAHARACRAVRLLTHVWNGATQSENPDGYR